MADYRRLTVSENGVVTVVRFIDKKILDESNIQEMGEELFRLVEKENRKLLLLPQTVLTGRLTGNLAKVVSEMGLIVVITGL